MQILQQCKLLQLLYAEPNVGVDYEYSLPSTIQQSFEYETYAWTFDQYSTCSVTCGGGILQPNIIDK